MAGVASRIGVSPLINVENEAREVLRVAKNPDHSDVGTQICQQKTAEQFVETLISSVMKGDKGLSEKMLALCGKCCFHSGEMNDASQKILVIANAFLHPGFASDQEARAFIATIL